MTTHRLASAILAATLVACSGTATVTGGPPAQTSVVVAVSPSAVQVAPAEAVAFAATVTGTAVTAVNWSVLEPAGGTVDGTGRYVAPGAAGVFHVKASSAADPTASATAVVTVTAPPPPPVVTLTVAPMTAAVDACQTVPFTATVTGSSNQAVAWTVQEGAAGGSITAGGVYTAPSAAGTYHVVATSAADLTKVVSASVTVAERVLSVQVSPATVTVPTSGTAQLSATVTTTCGSFASSALLTAAGTIVPQ
jgi:hypothetical protein